MLDVLGLDALLPDELVSETKVLEVEDGLLGELGLEDGLLELLFDEELLVEKLLVEEVLEKLEGLERLLGDEPDELNSKLLVLSSLWDDEEELVPAE